MVYTQTQQVSTKNKEKEIAFLYIAISNRLREMLSAK